MEVQQSAQQQRLQCPDCGQQFNRTHWYRHLGNCREQQQQQQQQQQQDEPPSKRLACDDEEGAAEDEEGAADGEGGAADGEGGAGNNGGTAAGDAGDAGAPTAVYAAALAAVQAELQQLQQHVGARRLELPPDAAQRLAEACVREGAQGESWRVAGDPRPRACCAAAHFNCCCYSCGLSGRSERGA
jgi:hypothetical protein